MSETTQPNPIKSEKKLDTQPVGFTCRCTQPVVISGPKKSQNSVAINDRSWTADFMSSFIASDLQQ